MTQDNRWWIGNGLPVYSYRRDPSFWPGWPFLIAILAVCLIMTIIVLSKAHAETDYSDEQIVNAIYHAEGGVKATFAYGIRSVPYRDIQDARRICFNTVRNNRKRFTKQTRYIDFLEFLASRYCPVGAANDPRGLNVNWPKNVRYFLERAVRSKEEGS